MNRLKALLIFIFLLMTGLSIWASGEQNLSEGLHALFQFRWGIATLADTYCCFFILYFWICYKEHSWPKRILWLCLGLGLGSIAACLYGMIEILKLPKNASIESLLLRQKSAS